VDLVDEQHVALDQVRQHRRQVTGTFQGRAGGDADGAVQLRGDDHRQGRLAEAGRAGQQHVIGRGTAPLGALQHQRQLLPHPRLPDELVEVAWPQRGFQLALPRLRQRGDRGVRAADLAEIVLVAHQRYFPMLLSAARRTADLSPWPLFASTPSTACSACLAGNPSEMSASITSERTALFAVGAAEPAISAVPTLPILSRSSRLSRPAPLRPMPGTWVSTEMLPSAIADRRVSGSRTAIAANASRGPIPDTVCNRTNSSRACASEKPYRVSESSRTTNDVCSWACSPTRSVASVAGAACTASPTPPTSTTAWSSPTDNTVPRTEEIIYFTPSARARCRAASRSRALCCLATCAARRSTSASRARIGSRHKWQIASARASAASAGVGRSGSASSRATIVITWALSARPAPVTAAFTSLGVWNPTGRPRRAAHNATTPLACAAPLTVRTSCWLKTRSTTTEPRWCSASATSTASATASSRDDSSAPAGVRTTV